MAKTKELLPAAAIEQLEHTRRQECVALLREIRGQLAGIAEGFWEIGDRLRRIRDGRLFAALGYEHFEPFLQGEVPAIANQADKMIAVCRTFVKQDTAGLGLEKARVLITYCRVKGDGVDPGELVRANAQIGETTVQAASVRDVRRAIVAVRAERDAKRGRTPRERAAAKAQREVVAALRQVLSGAGLGRATIEYRGAEVHVRFAARALGKRLTGREG